MGEGYIKLHRKLTEWGWYSDANTFRVFIHLLLLASFHDNEFRGIKLKPGQLIAGRKQLARDLGLTEQTIRTALNHLKSTNEITIKSTNKFSVITIEKWGMYQGAEEASNQQTNQQPNHQLTNNQPTTNHTQEGNNVKNVRSNTNNKNIYREVPEAIKPAFMEWATMRKQIKKPITSKRTVTMALNKLNQLSKDTAKQIELIEYATSRCWVSFWPIPKDASERPRKFYEAPEEVADAVPMPDDVKDNVNKYLKGL